MRAEGAETQQQGLNLVLKQQIFVNGKITSPIFIGINEIPKNQGSEFVF